MYKAWTVTTCECGKTHSVYLPDDKTPVNAAIAYDCPNSGEEVIIRFGSIVFAETVQKLPDDAIVATLRP